MSRAILVKDLIESQKNTIQPSQSDIMGGIILLKGPGQHLIPVLLLIPFNHLPLMFNFEQSRLE